MASQKISFLSLHFLILLLSIFVSTFSFASNYISLNQSVYGDQTITSSNGNFVLGFLQGSGSFYFYIAIWYKYQERVLWVANGEAPVQDPTLTASELKISQDGNLVLLDQSRTPVWSTNLSSIPSNSTVAVILDSGNLVLRDGSDPNKVFWQSCDHPTNTWLPGCYLGVNKVTGENRHLTCSNNYYGSNNYYDSNNYYGLYNEFGTRLFSLEIESNHFLIKWNNSKNYWSSGNWTGENFTSAPNFSRFAKFEYISNATVNYFTYSLKNNETLAVFRIDDSGQIKQILLADDPQQLSQYPDLPYQCGDLAFCGPFGVCLVDEISNCVCPADFSVAGNQSGGCVRNLPLQCGTNDVFQLTDYMTVHDIPHIIAAGDAYNCELACLSNCSCTAYSYDGFCSLWYGDLLSLQGYSDNKNLHRSIYLRMGSIEMKNSNNMSRGASWIIVGAIVGLIACLVGTSVMIWRRPKRDMMYKMKMFVAGSLVPFRYSELKQMTNDFSQRLGGGGFGSVFKGMLSDSTIVAVKKLEGIAQGEKQFRSEVSTIGVIQHVNLVRLHGFCSEGNWRLLVYEHMPNGSLDSHLFQNSSVVLDWKMRFQIALGTARGLSYLHEGCRDCIIHCDIKPENILLDASFVPKVADFGLAKNVDRNFSSVLTTMRGTLGYLAPEWISGGFITAKADVYSYGMMLFEIISGRRNTERLDTGCYFPVLAANKVVEGDVLSLLDPRLEGNANLEELDRVCKAACWCIQDNEVCRPSMGQLVQILEGILEVDMPPVPELLQALAAENIESIIYFSDDKAEHAGEEII